MCSVYPRSLYCISLTTGKEAQRCDAKRKKELVKIRKAMEEGNMDIARIYSENCIRHKNQGLNYLRMSARLDAVVGRVKTAQNVKMVSKQMSKAADTISSIMKDMNVMEVRTTGHCFKMLSQQTSGLLSFVSLCVACVILRPLSGLSVDIK